MDLWRGRPDDPRWVRPALLALLAVTAALYLWGLGGSGWANSFYSAAVQAGTKSWKAFFFGSFDSASFITVDKPPAALWVMELSARVFGVNAWSILVPQALEGVAAVGLLYLTVRRRFRPAAGLLAGAALALTPVAALMFRFNNPDALLTLLLVGAAYATTRALEGASTRWLLLAGALVGFGFLTKMLQAFLVVPVFALVYLYAAPTSVRRRLVQLAAAGGALFVSSAWWVAAVVLTPASARPYIGGSQDNNLLDLVFGYNGFGRLTGNETGSVGGGPAGAPGRWGATGLTRLFGTDMGGQVSWLLPAALVFLVGLLWLSRRLPRTSGQRAALLLWGGWLVLTGLVFSYAAGIIHPYYTVVLAPPVGALVGIGAVELWPHRRRLHARALLALALAVTGVWSYVLLARSPDWHPSLRVLVLLAGLGSAALLVTTPWLGRQAATGLAAVGLFAGLAGPTAYALQTAATAHSGALPSAGPAVTVGGGRFAAFRGPARPPGAVGALPGFGAPPQRPGGFGGSRGPGGFGGGRFGGGAGGGLGGLLDAATPDAALVSLLERDASSYTWVAAAVGANRAAGVQLGTGRPVLAIGGFNGTDPTPTLAQFQALVAAHEVHYFIGGGFIGGGFIGGGGFGPGARGGTGSQIAQWVADTFTATTVGGVTVYDLTR